MYEKNTTERDIRRMLETERKKEKKSTRKNDVSEGKKKFRGGNREWRIEKGKPDHVTPHMLKRFRAELSIFIFYTECAWMNWTQQVSRWIIT